MPAISLRLTEEELEQLRAWAKDGRRSVQKEIIWRLFDAEGAQAAKIGLADRIEKTPIKVPADGTLHELPEEDTPETVAEKARQAREVLDLAQEHFKPDFGKKLT